MTDFFALPQDTVQPPDAERMTPMPQRPSPYDNPDQVGQAMGAEETRLTVGEWNQRARVARECAHELQAAIESLRYALSSNALGDCPEGTTLYEKLRSTVDLVVDQFGTQYSDLNDLAENCSRAGSALSSADGAGARPLQA